MAQYGRAAYVGTTLPAISEAVTLLSTPAIAGVASNFLSQGDIHKAVLDLRIDQSGTLTCQTSPDGSTWTTIYTESLAASAANTSYHREFPVEGLQDFRIRFTNGATAQTTFAVNACWSDKIVNPGASGISGAGAVIAGADGMANPTAEQFLTYTMGFNGTTWDRVRTAIVAKVSTFVGLLNTIGMGRYNLTPATLTDGDVQLVQLDSAGNTRGAEQFMAVAEDNTNGVFATQVLPLAATTYAPTKFAGSLGTLTTLNEKATAGNLFSISATNRNGAVRYLQLFNSTASTATVLYQWIIPPGSTIVLGTDFFTQGGWNFTVGITWGVSTTAGTYAAATASETDVFGSFK